MSTIRVLHVDDEPDIREVVELSLALDPAFSVRSCGSGAEAVAMAPQWRPDMVLCDVMMPVLDGPATLAKLRDCPQTADTPVVFMTARAQRGAVNHFKSLGAAGVIVKPFDPMTLSEVVRKHLCSANIAKCGEQFVKRLRADVATLGNCRSLLRSDPSAFATVRDIEAIAHKLAGAAGVFGLHSISSAAAAVEDAAIERRLDRRSMAELESEVTVLIASIEQGLVSATTEPAHDDSL